MRQQVQERDYRRFYPGVVRRRLPDGRRLVIEMNQLAKVVDVTGNEMEPSPSEIAALMAVSEMSFPKKSRTRDGLLD